MRYERQFALAHECRFNPGYFHLMGGAFRFED